ncbi:thermonuclease family protein [Sphingobium ummariense]
MDCADAPPRYRIAGIDAAETQAGQARCRAEIALGRSATARAGTLLDGRTVTAMRVGRSYNRTVARVTLAGRDVGSELVAAGAARWWPRWQRKPDWCARADEDKGIAASRPAPAGRGAADSQGISRSGGTAKSPAAKWARIAS